MEEQMALPTVKIKADTQYGYMLINESDYDAKIHELYEDVDQKPARKTKVDA